MRAWIRAAFRSAAVPPGTIIISSSGPPTARATCSARAPEAERQKNEQAANDGTHSRTSPAHILRSGR